MKKAVTTYPGVSHKKFNQTEFNKQIESFYDWEKKKKEKVEKMKKEQEENKLKLLKDPVTNKKANLKFNTNPKNLTTIERLYDQDLKKRKDKRVLLTKIYTPSFQPTLYTKGEDFEKILQQNNKAEMKLRKSLAKMHNNYEEESKENKDDIDLYKYKERKLKTHKNLYEKEDKLNNKKASKPKKKNKKEKEKEKSKRNKSVEKKKVKMKISDDEEEEDNEDESESESKNDKEPEIDEEKVGMTLRNRLFKNMKPIRSSSVGKRRK